MSRLPTPARLALLAVLAVVLVVPSPLPLGARIIFLGALLVGGVLWMTDTGDPDR